MLEAALRDDHPTIEPNSTVIALGLYEEDQQFAEAWCVRVGREASDPALRTSAALAVGHLARRFGTVGDAARQLVIDSAKDPTSDGRAQDALEDLNQFATSRWRRIFKRHS